MSPEQRLKKLAQLEAADRSASGQAHIDINSVGGQCPVHQPFIFVLPVRYACSEQAATHPASQPGITPDSHPMAARLLREGFVYVWQGAQGLQRYAVAINSRLRAQPLHADDTRVERGNLCGVAVSKHTPVCMLYTEYPLNPAACQQLLDPQVRARRMRQFDMRRLADELQAAHCVPLRDADQLMGELLPQTYAQAVTLDHLHNGQTHRAQEQLLAQRLFENRPDDDIQHNITALTQAQRWNHERIQVAARYPDIRAEGTVPGEWSAAPWSPFKVRELLEGTHQQAQGLYAVLACLDDDLGVLRDINHEQEHVESRHEQWQQDHQLRLSIGGFVRSLITEDGAEIAGQLSYRYREYAIELTPEQGELMLKVDHELETLFREEARLNQQRGRLYSYSVASTKLAQVRADIQRTVAPVREFIPAELHTEVEAVVRDYRASKVANRENHFVSEKVAQYIDLPAMNEWLDQTAPAHFEQVQQRHTCLYADRGVYLKRHHSGTWFVDYNDPEHQAWLGRLAVACLSAQCLRKQGAEQYADYVRSADEGALRQLFYGWSPTLEAAVISTSRSGELMAALSLENQANAEQALIKILGPLGAPILANLAQLARETDGVWNTLIKRSGAALLLLSGEPGAPLSGAWLNIMIAARMGSQTGLRFVSEGGRQVLQLVGKAAEDLTQWAQVTGKAIGTGRVANIVNSPAVQKSGGVIALAALLLNSWNAGRYLSDARVLEGMDEQRQHDTASATLYAGAALVAVIDVQVRKGFWGGSGVDGVSAKIGNQSFTASVLTLFGGALGFISLLASLKEYRSLQLQLDDMQHHLDPWLQLRQAVVKGQVIAFGAQALLGLVYTFKSIAADYGVVVANANYLRWIGPVNLLLAVLGVLYLIAWFMKQTPLQNFLDYCCWSKLRAKDLSAIAFDRQAEELSRLYQILFAPRLSFNGEARKEPANNRMGFVIVPRVYSLTIDLPGADPSNTYFDISIVGDPVDIPVYRKLVSTNDSGKPVVPPRPMQDIGRHWIQASSCQWIPYQEGQGLRLSGPFNAIPDLFGSSPQKVWVRVCYHSSITSLLNTRKYNGGDQGQVYIYTPDTGLISGREESIPELDKAIRFSLSAEQNSQYLQPVRTRS